MKAQRWKKINLAVESKVVHVVHGKTREKKLNKSFSAPIAGESDENWKHFLITSARITKQQREKF